jgi:glutamyl-tRNA synthetase
VRPDPALLAQHFAGSGAGAVRAFVERAEALASWDRASLSLVMKGLVGEMKLKMPLIAFPLRVALTGRTQTPSIDLLMETMGKETVLGRLRAALAAWPAG